jgi:type III restriction enzyme
MKDKHATENSDFNQKKVFENAILTKKDWTKGHIVTVESEVKEQEIHDIPYYEQDELFGVHIPSGESKDISIFDEKSLTEREKERKLPSVFTFDVISDNVLRFAINSNKNFNFNKLKLAYPMLTSMSQFIKRLGFKRITIDGDKNKLAEPEIQLKVAILILKEVEKNVKTEQKKIYVTKHFFPKEVRESFDKKIYRRTKRIDSEVGSPQSNPANQSYRLDLSQYDWYVYDENYGTCEEKSFVKWFADFVPVLQENNWTEIMLARNEKAVKLYSWFKGEMLGTGFEPDFVLFMKKNDIDYVFYIEPKGNLFYIRDRKDFGNEQWKENLLLEIEKVVTTQQQQTSTTEMWRLIGMPFYNELYTREKFREKFERIVR